MSLAAQGSLSSADSWRTGAQVFTQTPPPPPQAAEASARAHGTGGGSDALNRLLGRDLEFS